MNARRCVALLLLVLTFSVAGCRRHDDIYARYLLERMVWKAQVQERKINIGFIKASQRDLTRATDMFMEITAYDPLAGGNTMDWDPRVVADIRRLRLVSRIALANLYFLGEHYREASDTYVKTLGDESLEFNKKLDVRLNLARTMYLSGESELLEKQCAAIYEDIASNEQFWSGEVDLPDVFLSVPLVLVRLYRDRGDTASYDSFSRTAEGFYTRVANEWPGKLIAAKAVYSRTLLYLQQERWSDALSDIKTLRTNDAFEKQHANLMLLEGELLTNALNERSAGQAVFEELVRTHPKSPAAYGARYNLAVLKLQAGEERVALDTLRELEKGPEAGVPSEISARAMLTRGTHLERAGRWDEALTLLRRVTRLYPHTSPAMEAPLAITRHYIKTGERQLAERNLQRSTEFYLSLLERQSKYRGDRLLVEDFLVENYMTMDQAREVAELLEQRSGEWDEISSIGAVLKSSVIYSAVLDDKENAARVLRKSIELFPQTRYAKIAQQRLDLLEEGGNN
jgi:TolA-binding protein